MKKYFYLYFCALVASFAGLLAGYDTGVISGALLYISQDFEISSYQSALIVSSVSIGAVIGAFLNGLLIDRIGRRNILLLTAFVFGIGSLFCYFSLNVYHLIVSRLFLGFALGVVSFAAPLYLSEISPKEKRGQIVSFYQLAITFGILLSYLINFYCAKIGLSWRVMLGLGLIPALVLFIGMFFQKDTPRYLVLKNKIDEAKEVFKRIGNQENTEEEINLIKQAVPDEKFVLNKKMLCPIFIGFGIMFAQIATGINAIIYYTPTIFKTVGFATNENALFATILIGLINFLMTFVAIAFCDKWGRKPLLHLGLSGMLISLLCLSFAYLNLISFSKVLAVISCMTYIVSFSMSLGPIALLLIAEIFPLKYRGQMMSYAIITNFVFNFIVTTLFPISLDKIGGCLTFLIFAFMCVISILFVYFFVPETKNVSLEEIEAKWNKI